MIKVQFNPAGCQNARNAEIAGIIIADIKDVKYNCCLKNPGKKRESSVQKCMKVRTCLTWKFVLESAIVWIMRLWPRTIQDVKRTSSVSHRTEEM